MTSLSRSFLMGVAALFFVVLDVQRGHLETALIDGFYVPLALTLWFKSRAAA